MSDKKIDLIFGIIGWANSGATIAAIKLDLTPSELFTILFVTVPVGLWSWLRLIDALKARFTKNARTQNARDTDS
jgi:hypothetical protein